METMKDNKVAVVIVTYNTPVLIKPQLECIEKFCTDEVDVIIIDNSSDEEAAAAIKHHSGANEYVRVHSGGGGGSSSHAFACNFAYFKLRDRYDYFLLLDHDNFPIRPFSVVELLGDKVMGGIGQKKSKTYFWPGCLIWNNKKAKDLDFSCNHELGLDTGGNLYKVIEDVGAENCIFFGEEYYQNQEFLKSRYNFYSLIYGLFMHFIAGSNWPGVEHHEERINSLLNILKNEMRSNTVS